MRWSIRHQILAPFAVLQIAAVAALTLAAAIFSVQRVERETARRLENVVLTLRDSSFPLTERVLQQMRGLSGAEFAIVNPENKVTTSTLSAPLREIPDVAIPARSVESVRFGDHHPIPVGTRRFFPTRVSGLGADGATDLLILFPEDQWDEARRSAIVVPITVGGMTICGMIVVSAWLAARFGRRMQTIEQQFARIAEGDFEPIPLTDRDDELRDLSRSANQLASGMERLTASIRQQERETLITQLASGLAHQFRNAITGARMAIQVHRRRCASTSDDSLDVALRQLSLTEQQIKGLLRITRDGRRALSSAKPIAGQLKDVVGDVVSLVGPLSDHEHVHLNVESDIPAFNVTDCDAIGAALLNLVLNAIEAAGPNGTVDVAVRRQDDSATIDVSDTGRGVADEIANTLFDPFVTSKPEGVGLGLVLAVEAARQHGGTVSYRRDEGRTVFSLTLLDVDGSVTASDEEPSRGAGVPTLTGSFSDR